MKAPHLLLGRLGERVACRFLIRIGYDVLTRRFPGRWGEIDIVAYEEETLVFVEVKARGTRKYGEPWEFVDWQKRQTLLWVAEEFIGRYDLGDRSYRFDIVSVVSPGQINEEITLLRNAF